jgi:hypothetical protein
VLVNEQTGTLSHAQDPDAIMETVREEYEIMLLGPDSESEPEPSWEGQDGESANLLEQLF